MAPSVLTQKTAVAARPVRPAPVCAMTRPAKRPPDESTILLVDDDPAVRLSLQRVLALEGWRIISAADGEEALEYLAQHEPDLIITDLRMHAVSGWDLLFHENLQRPDLPIFVITALPVPVVGGADRFATEFFQKPLDLDALVTAIHRCLGRRSSPLSPR